MIEPRTIAEAVALLDIERKHREEMTKLLELYQESLQFLNRKLNTVTAELEKALAERDTWRSRTGK
jgi:hypothetical protein